MQSSLARLNEESLRFQAACEEIEAHQIGELTELKGHLAMALSSFQQLTAASEQRESKMKLAMRDTVERSVMVETEREAMKDKMHEELGESAEALAELKHLKDGVEKCNSGIAEATAEKEQATNRLSRRP